MFFWKNDPLMRSPASVTITIRTVPEFCIWKWSDWPDMFFLDPIHIGFVPFLKFLYGPIWSHMAPYGPIWSHMVPYMVPYGLIYGPAHTRRAFSSNWVLLFRQKMPKQFLFTQIWGPWNSSLGISRIQQILSDPPEMDGEGPDRPWVLQAPGPRWQ